MKVLLITNKPFLPTLDGGNSATKSFVNKLLSEDFEINNITFSSEKHPFEPRLYNSSGWNKLKTLHVPISLKIKPLEAFKALIQGKSYQLSRFESEAMIERFHQLIAKNDFTYVVLDSLYSAHSIESFKNAAPRAKFILRSHNVESKLTSDKSKNQRNLLKKIYLNLLARQLEKREKEILKKCDLILSISEDDTEIFQSWGIDNVQTLPFYPEKSNIKWKDNPNCYMHFGAMNWKPNLESYHKLVNDIFPEIKKIHPESELFIAGSFMDNLDKPTIPGIIHLGFVEDKYHFLANNGILLAPIQSSSGVRIKIIEALSIGVPVITTKAGAKGIPSKNNFGLVVCENDQEFIETLVDLAKNADKRKKLSENAQEFYSKWYAGLSLKTIFTNDVSK
jgi:glycosyltransferase involved in cell wall biosynthesis